MSTTADSVINGVRVQSAREAKQQMQADPTGDVALPNYSTRVQWTSAYQTKTSLDNQTVIVGDEPPVYGGNGVGASPQELLLTSIGNCLIATFVGGLSAAGITIKSLSVDVSGQVNFLAAFGVEQGNPGFLGINANVDIQTDHDKEEVDALMRRLYPTAPIPATITQPTPIQLTIQQS